DGHEVAMPYRPVSLGHLMHHTRPVTNKRHYDPAGSLYAAIAPVMPVSKSTKIAPLVCANLALSITKYASSPAPISYTRSPRPLRTALGLSVGALIVTSYPADSVFVTYRTSL